MCCDQEGRDFGDELPRVGLRLPRGVGFERRLQVGVTLKNGPESTLRGTGPEHRSVIGRDGGPGLA